MKLFMTIAVVSSFLITTTYANEWQTVAKLKAGGATKVIDVNQQISKVAVACMEGKVKIVSVEVESSGKKYPFSVGNELGKNETQQLTVGDKINCGKLHIADEGQGEYEVRVR